MASNISVKRKVLGGNTPRVEGHRPSSCALSTYREGVAFHFLLTNA